MIRELVLAVSLFFCLHLSAQPQDSAKQPSPRGQETSKPSIARIRVGAKGAESQLKHKVKPVYPSEARDQRIEGTVQLHVIISTEGKVKPCQVVSGDPVLAKAAVDAVRHWEYKPTLLNGEPLEVDTTVDVIFALRK